MKRLSFVLLTAAVLLTLGAPLLAKGKPGGGGGGGGEPPADPAVAWYWYQTPSIYVANADGSNKTRIVQAPDGRYLNAPRWTPDGRLLFASDIWGPAVHVMNPDGTGRTKLFEPIRFSSSLQPDWSPVATPTGAAAIVYADWPAGEGDSDIFVINPDGTGRRNLTASPGRYEASPVWSHDGTRLAFWDVTSKDIVIAELGVVNGELAITAESSLLAQLPASALEYPVNPAWAQTRNEILIRALIPGDASKAFDVWRIDLDDPSNPINISSTARKHEGFPSWTTGDARISYTDSRDNLVTVPLDGLGDPVIVARKARVATWRR